MKGIKIKEICEALEKWAPLDLQESYDNSGLIVGDPEAVANGALICLDSTEEVIDEAIERGCNLVIAHHPIVFSGLKSFTGADYIQRTVMKAIKNDIAIYAIHTNLDSVMTGVNQKIGERLGIKNLRILSTKTPEGTVGAGMIGELAEEMNTVDFLQLIKEKMEAGVVRYTSVLKENVKKIAFCGGSGSFLLQDAIRQEADVFISSDFKYHQFFDAENHLVIADIGHFEAEQFTKDLIHSELSEKFPKFAVRLSGVNTNPVNYL